MRANGRDRTGNAQPAPAGDPFRDWRIYDGHAAQDAPPVRPRDEVVPKYWRRPWWWPFRPLGYVVAAAVLALVVVGMVWGVSYGFAYTAMAGALLSKATWYYGG